MPYFVEKHVMTNTAFFDKQPKININNNKTTRATLLSVNMQMKGTIFESQSE